MATNKTPAQALKEQAEAFGITDVEEEGENGIVIGATAFLAEIENIKNEPVKCVICGKPAKKENIRADGWACCGLCCLECRRYTECFTD